MPLTPTTPMIAKFLSQWIPVVAYSRLIGFLIIFVGVFLVISILGVIIKYLMSISFLGWADRISGGVFGLIKGFSSHRCCLSVSPLFFQKMHHLSKIPLWRPTCPMHQYTWQKL